MAKEKQMIVIKKITISGGGHHGGAWKVAFADFMTAMMAFFLCMWLLSISPQARQSISEYFSTPSVIEYRFKNFGVEITLEKLFNDILSEPFDAVGKLFEPMDRTPNVFEFGMDKMALSYLADKLGEETTNLEVNRNEIKFSIPDTKLFIKGSSDAKPDFATLMDHVKQVTSGLEFSKVTVVSQLFLDGVDKEDPKLANKVAEARKDLILAKVQTSFEHESSSAIGKIDVRKRKDPSKVTGVTGFIRFEIERVKPKEEPGAEKAESKVDSESPKKSADLYEELNSSFQSEIRKPNPKKKTR